MYGEKGLGPTKDSGFRVYGRGMATFFLMVAVVVMVVMVMVFVLWW